MGIGNTKATAPAIGFAAAFFFAAPAAADCGLAQVSVTGTPDETELACGAIHDVRAYFDDLGFSAAPPVAIQFSHDVRVNIDGGEGLHVSGCFDAGAQTIELTSWGDGVRPARLPWGLPWDREMVRAVAGHELVHWAVAGALGADYDRVGTAWHEFVAYAVQFELMAPDLRERILAASADKAAFGSPSEVNEITWAADPDGFAVRSHRYARQNGGGDFIRRILLGTVDFDMGDLPALCR